MPGDGGTIVSRAITSLDTWLEAAEQVLSDQRDHAISPSEGTVWDQSQEQAIIALATLSAGLERVLAALCAAPGRWILIIEHNIRRHLFWQALAFEDGSLCTEVVSNTYLEGQDRWTREHQERLLALGWEPPNAPKRPNFINIEATTSPETGVVCRRAIATLRELFGLDDEDEVFVKVFSSCIRGNTPAGPIYEVDADSVEQEAAIARPTPRRYFRPNVDGSDEEQEADISAWLGAVLGSTRGEAATLSESLDDRR
jgi:hypothetical protein